MGSQRGISHIRQYGVSHIRWKDFYRIPAYKPQQVVDATGCGDTYTIGYLYRRVSGASIEEAGRFAAAMSTLKIEKSGPFCGNKEDVLQCMKTAEQMF